MKITEKSLIFTLEDRVTPSCHASTVCVTDKGTVLVAWFGGRYEKADDVEIYLTRRENGSDKWSSPIMVSVKDDIACWNPVLFSDGEKITLCYKKGKEIPDWQTYVTYSYDDGITWSEPCELVHGDISGGRGPVKNKPLICKNGAIIAGASHETHEPDRLWRAFADISFDGGNTWKRGAYLNNGVDTKLIQPSLWEDEHGVHMLLRSQNGYLYRSDADFDTLEFCAAYKTEIPNNNSGIDLVKAGDKIYLVCNPISTSERTPISLLESEDGGNSFNTACNLFHEEGGEFSYPAIVCHDGELLITFTYNRVSVMFVRVKI